MTPQVLITHTLDWPNAARLAIAFRAADCRVHALCRPRHVIRTVSSLEQLHPLNLFAPLKSLRSAINSAKPDIVIPCDDTAARHLHRLHHEETLASPNSPTPITSLINRSLGDPASYELLATRSLLPAIAESAAVLTPQTTVINSLEQFREWTEREGFPAVLKTDRSWGGEGVVIAENMKQAEIAFRAMRRRPPLLNAFKRVLVNRDPNLFVKRYGEPPPAITVQKFISGTIANTAVACWEGELLDSLSVEVIVTHGKTGTATVVKTVENAQMLKCAKRIVQHLQISGFCGFDFMIERESNRTYLIEINPRATQINHIVLGPGHDLPGTLRARIANEPPRKAAVVTTSPMIALFPQEWKRNRRSELLATSYHDVPHAEPAFIRACTGRAKFY